MRFPAPPSPNELDRRMLRLLTLFRITAGSIALLTAALVLIGGWVDGVDAIKSIEPGFSSMKVNTAISIAALGVALVLTGTDRRYRPIGSVLAGAALMVGLVTLAEYAFHWNAGIDQLWIKDIATPSTAAPGRPGAVTALMVGLLGAALLCAGRQALSRPKTLAAVTALVVSWTILNGYLFGPQAVHELQLIGPVALHSAVILLLLGIGVLATEPLSRSVRAMLTPGISGIICRWLLPPAILAPPTLGWFLTRKGAFDIFPAQVDWALYSALSTLGAVWLIMALAHRISVIDDQRVAAAALSRQLREALDDRETFKAVIENSSDFIGISDAQGRPNYLNPAGRQIIGLDADFPIDTLQITDCYPPELHSFVTDVILSEMQTHGRWQGETFFRDFRSQQAIPVSDTHFVVHESATGRILGWATITRDISDIKRARDEREVANRELEEVNRQLNRAVQARNEMLGIVAHDLRNPLNSIVIEAEFLKRQCVAVEGCGSEPAAAIYRSAMRMNRLIQDLLDVARVEAGGLTLDRHRVPVRQVVADSMDAHSTTAARMSVELRLEVAGGVPDVWADRDRLLQVFENLIGNALKFTGRGGSVTVGAVPRDGEVLFSVSDTGVGISAEDAPHVFDRFWQARKDERRGAGLGLAIVKGIVEAHGGRVWVVSTPGHGATFYFTIPTEPPIESLTLTAADPERSSTPASATTATRA